jgi:hypothetical protein
MKIMNIKKDTDYPFEARVTGFKKHKGYSELIVTYCCSATPCYYVVFPAIGYEGYFQESDVEVKSQNL